jgi:protein subunit release factor A
MEQEYIIEYYPPRNAGGQHVGIISKGIKITHIPSGLIAICDMGRSQMRNKETAMRMIAAGLNQLTREGNSL